MSEDQGEYIVDLDRDAVLARLLESFTPGQLLLLADVMREALERHYGRVEIEIEHNRMFIWGGKSRDAGKVKGR